MAFSEQHCSREETYRWHSLCHNDPHHGQGRKLYCILRECLFPR